MTEFLLMFRERLQDHAPTQQEVEAYMKNWDNWIGGIAAQGKLSGGNRLIEQGKVMRPAGVVTDGPFVETKERLSGYIIVKAESLDDATTMAHGCPVFDWSGSVEIRPVAGR